MCLQKVGHAHHGIQNRGNTCFIAAVVQMLSASASIRHRLQLHFNQHGDDGIVDSVAEFNFTYVSIVVVLSQHARNTVNDNELGSFCYTSSEC